jgi:exosortase
MQGTALHRMTQFNVGTIVGLLVMVVCLLWLYAPLAVILLRVWTDDPNYSHGFLVPVASLYFASRCWRRGARVVEQQVSSREVSQGMLLAVAGITLHFCGLFMNALLLDTFSLVCVIWASLLILGGRSALSEYAFAVAFLLFMAPVPDPLYQVVANALQQTVSTIAATLLGLMGVPVYREGYLIHLPNYSMEVAQACSGLRQLTGFLALGTATAFLHPFPGWLRMCFMLASVPISIFVNCCRVTFTALVAMYGDPNWSEGVFHTMEGMVLLALGLIPFAVAAYIAGQKYGKTAPETMDTVDDLQATDGNRASAADEDQQLQAPCKLGRRVLLVALWFAGVSALSHSLMGHMLEAEQAVTTIFGDEVHQVPYVLGAWQGADFPCPEEWKYGDEYVYRVYQNRITGHRLFMWIVFSKTGLDRNHHPEVCMAVSGKPEYLEMRREFDIGRSQSPIQQYMFGDQYDRQWVFYWYYTLPLHGLNELDQVQRLFVNLRGRPPSLSIQVFSPELTDDDGTRSRDFVQLMDAALQRQVGSGAKRGSEPAPIIIQ